MSRIRSVAKHALVTLLYVSGALWWAKRWLSRRGAVTVLMFHRVLRDDDYAETNSVAGMVMRASTFEEMASYVSGHCEPIDILAAPQALGRHSSSPRVAYTFDDGWLDTAKTAHPIAERYEVPIAVFVCPSLVGKDTPFWPERAVSLLKKSPENARSLDLDTASGYMGIHHAVEKLKATSPAERAQMLDGWSTAAALAQPSERHVDSTMDWNAIAAMHSSGVVFGSHTDTHPILTQVSPSQVRDELRVSKQQIEAHIGSLCSTLAYPNGNCSDEIRRIAEETGYRAAFTTAPGAWLRGTDPLLIPRINIWEGTATSPSGRFSRMYFDYAVFWRAYRTSRRNA